MRAPAHRRLGLLAAGCLLLACLGGGEPLPLAEVERARAALRSARVEARLEESAEASPKMRRAIEAGALLERRLAEERGVRWRAPRSREIARLARAAEDAALAALQAARAEADRRRAAREGRRAELALRLDGIAADLAHSPADRGLRARWRRVGLALATAEEAERACDPAAAEAGTRAAAAELAALEELLGERVARLHEPASRRRWQAWVDATVAEGGTAVVVDKLGRRCVLLRGGRVAAVYPAELGRNGLSDKLYAGDGATPEGRYRIVEKKDRGATRYHRALMLDYPTADDLQEYRAARRRGLVPPGRGVGGLIEIHGHGGRQTNWTSGCVALRNEHMDRLFEAVGLGTPVTIVGTARLPDPSQERAPEPARAVLQRPAGEAPAASGAADAPRQGGGR